MPLSNFISLANSFHPLQVGLWIYELAGRLPTGESILLFCALQSANKSLKESTPVHTIIDQWVEIIKSKGHKNTLLCFDTYYFSANSRQLLLENDIKVCASISPSKFPSVVNLVASRITKPGAKAAVYNSAHGEFLLGYHNPNPQVKYERMDCLQWFSLGSFLHRLEKSMFGATPSSPFGCVMT